MQKAALVEVVKAGTVIDALFSQTRQGNKWSSGMSTVVVFVDGWASRVAMVAVPLAPVVQTNIPLDVIGADIPT